MCIQFGQPYKMLNLILNKTVIHIHQITVQIKSVPVDKRGYINYFKTMNTKFKVMKY